MPCKLEKEWKCHLLNAPKPSYFLKALLNILVETPVKVMGYLFQPKSVTVLGKVIGEVEVNK